MYSSCSSNNISSTTQNDDVTVLFSNMPCLLSYDSVTASSQSVSAFMRSLHGFRRPFPQPLHKMTDCMWTHIVPANLQICYLRGKPYVQLITNYSTHNLMPPAAW